MNLEATGFKTTRRIMRDDGTLCALVEKLTNDKWMIFVDEKRVTEEQFVTPRQALSWARGNLK